MSDNLDNQVEYVRSLAIAFRMAISRAQESGELSRTVIASFPRACCGYTSDLLQRYLDKHGIKTWYVSGTYRDPSTNDSQSHAWLDVDSWTVKDTEKAVSIFYDNWRHDIFNDMVKRFDLPLNKKVGELSRGMQMKLMLACAFSHDAKLLILDEPTSGLDPLTRDEFLEILQDYIRDGQRSVLFSTHITTDLERVADYITLINRGNMIFTGSMEDLLSSYRLIKGKPCDLTADLEKNILGLRKTAMGFEGLITANAAVQYKHCVLDTATIDEIIICIGKGGTKA